MTTRFRDVRPEPRGRPPSHLKIKMVQGMYEAFGRGDVPAILDVVTDDVDWASEPDGAAPWHGVRRGKAEPPSFFAAIGEHLDVTEFTPLAIASSATDVMAVIRFGLTVRATGRSGAMDIHHWWRFRDDLVCWYRGTEDTALTARLLAP